MKSSLIYRCFVLQYCRLRAHKIQGIKMLSVALHGRKIFSQNFDVCGTIPSIPILYEKLNCEGKG